MGDADIAHKGHTNCELRFGHKEADKEYLQWKWDELRSIGLFTKPPKPRTSGHGFPQWRLTSNQDSFFNQYREMFYPDGEKVVTIEILDKLEPLGLAVWYQDDGTLVDNGRSMGLHVEGFGVEGAKLIKDWFKAKYDLHFHFHKSNGNQVALYLGRRGTPQFLNIVRSYIQGCMRRKII